MKKYLPVFFLLILSIIASYLYYLQQKKPVITNFEECVAAGNPVMESYPAQCKANDQTFIQNIGNEIEKMEVIRIDEPRPNTQVTSPLQIKGNARGNWFFEGSFEVYLLDEKGKEIARNNAQAQQDWMTEEFVSYESKLIFTQPATKTGTLVLEKNNASGLPVHDDKLEVPVMFE